jgi:hypothetical protein
METKAAIKIIGRSNHRPSSSFVTTKGARARVRV